MRKIMGILLAVLVMLTTSAMAYTAYSLRGDGLNMYVRDGGNSIQSQGSYMGISWNYNGVSTQDTAVTLKFVTPATVQVGRTRTIKTITVTYQKNTQKVSITGTGINYLNIPVVNLR